MRYAYPARLEPSDNGSILLSFRDLPEAMTFGGDMMEWKRSPARRNCLDAALLIRRPTRPIRP